MLTDVVSGVESALELRYLRDVEQPHALPTGTRNEPEKQDRSIRYRDVRYRAWHVIVELDGRAAHPLTEMFRDRKRDNGATVAGDRALRYGWRDVVGEPCAVSEQVVAVLRLGGWTGQPRPCGPRCAAARSARLPDPPVPVRVPAGVPVA